MSDRDYRDKSVSDLITEDPEVTHSRVIYCHLCRLRGYLVSRPSNGDSGNGDFRGILRRLEGLLVRDIVRHMEGHLGSNYVCGLDRCVIEYTKFNLLFTHCLVFLVLLL